MKQMLTTIGALASLASVALWADGIEWHESFEAAQQAAQQSDKPIMVDFWAPNCGWCDELDRQTYSHPEVIARSREFECAKVDASVRRDLATKYAVPGFPTIMFMTPSGVPVYSVSSFVPPEPFLEIMNRALEGYEAYKLAAELEAKFAENPQDGGLALQIAEAYHTCQQLERAADYAGKALELGGDDAQIRSAALLLQGKSLAEIGEPGQAINLLSAFAQENPESDAIWEAKLYLGFSHLQVGNGEQGVALLQEIVDNTPGDARAHVLAQRLLDWYAGWGAGGQ